MATSNTDGGYKRFSGAGANGRDLKRWKNVVSFENDHNDDAYGRGQISQSLRLLVVKI